MLRAQSIHYMEETRYFVVNWVVSLMSTDPFTQDTNQLAIHMLWIRRLSPIDKCLMHM